jgi:HEAT repeat protein
MLRHALCYMIICVALLSACKEQDKENPSASTSASASEDQQQNVKTNESSVDYEALRHKITYSQASLADVYTALSATDAQTLTNIVYALYSMRWLRGVQFVLDDLWILKKEKHPEFNWGLLQKAPVRLALASTLNRIRIIETDDYLEYIRAHKLDDDEFNRAQVVIALGFNGDPVDIDYLKSMADSDNHYVVQSAVTSLAIFGGMQARNMMIDLWKKHGDSPRGKLILELLDKSYKWRPETTPVDDDAIKKD